MFIKIAAGVVAAVILFAIVYVLYVVLQYRRIEDEKTLEIKNPEAEKVRTKESYVVGTYNIGFGAYDKDFSFFMNKGRMLDGDRLIRGKYGKAASREAVVRNTEGAFSAARALKPDFMLFQEVDEKSHRARGVNQLEAAREAFRDYSSVYAENFHTAYLLYPLNDPHGKTRAGIVTLFSKQAEKSVRYSYPVSGGFAKYFDLDRCFSATYFPVSNSEKRLVLVNQHMSAYDRGGVVRRRQWETLSRFISSEYLKGNYVIVGGDFNHDIAGSIGYFPTRQQKPDWVYPLREEDLPEHFSFAASLNAPTCRCSEMPYTKGVNYTLVIDGFIVSDNVTVKEVENIDTGFEFTDHNPVKMTFVLDE